MIYKDSNNDKIDYGSAKEVIDLQNPFIVGDRIYLRGITREDIAGNMANWPNDSEVTEYMVMGTVPNSGPLYCSWDSIDREYEKLRESKRDVIFAIVENKKDLLIGIAGLYEINWLSRFAELRIVIGEKKFWNKGYGTEAVNLLVEYGFDKLNLHKVELGVNASDERANKAYIKAGFVYEGTKRHYHFRNGRYYDAKLYSILEDEYRKMKKSGKKKKR